MHGMELALRDRLATWAASVQRLCSFEHARKAAALKEQMRKLRALAEPVREGRLDLSRRGAKR